MAQKYSTIEIQGESYCLFRKKYVALMQVETAMSKLPMAKGKEAKELIKTLLIAMGKVGGMYATPVEIATLKQVINTGDLKSMRLVDSDHIQDVIAIYKKSFDKKESKKTEIGTSISARKEANKKVFQKKVSKKKALEEKRIKNRIQQRERRKKSKEQKTFAEKETLEEEKERKAWEEKEDREAEEAYAQRAALIEQQEREDQEWKLSEALREEEEERKQQEALKKKRKTFETFVMPTLEQTEFSIPESWKRRKKNNGQIALHSDEGPVLTEVCINFNTDYFPACNIICPMLSEMESFLADQMWDRLKTQQRELEEKERLMNEEHVRRLHEEHEHRVREEQRFRDEYERNHREQNEQQRQEASQLLEQQRQQAEEYARMLRDRHEKEDKEKQAILEMYTETRIGTLPIPFVEDHHMNQDDDSEFNHLL
jgi:hypothetical protein